MYTMVISLDIFFDAIFSIKEISAGSSTLLISKENRISIGDSSFTH